MIDAVKNLKTAMSKSGTSVTAAAELVGCNKSTVSRWISGSSTPYQYQISAIERATERLSQRSGSQASLLPTSDMQ